MVPWPMPSGSLHLCLPEQMGRASPARDKVPCAGVLKPLPSGLSLGTACRGPACLHSCPQGGAAVTVFDPTKLGGVEA